MTALSEIEQELQATFPSHSYQEWKEAAEALLKGKPFEKLLVTKTYEGFDLQPIFRKEDLEALTFTKDFPGAGRLRSFPFSGWQLRKQLEDFPGATGFYG